MKIIKLELKNLFRNRFVSVLLVGLLIFFTCDWIYYFIKLFDIHNFDSYIIVFSDSQKYSLYLFIAIMFVAFDYFSLSKKNNVEETIRTTSKGFLDSVLARYLICILCIIVYAFVCIAINCIVAVHFKVATYEFINNIVLSTLINYLFCGLVAINVGLLAASFNKRVKSYIVLFLSAILFSGILEKVSDVFLFTIGINIFPITNLFNIFVPNLKSVFNFSFGLSVLPYRIFLIAFWYFFMLFLIFLLQPKRTFETKLMSGLSILLSLIMVVSFYMPSSKYIRNNDPAEANFHDFNYYATESEVSNKYSETEAFDIIKYDMKISIRNQLYANVTIIFTSTKNNKYVFTLYHGYKVTDILDSSGKKIDYERSGDYIYFELADNKTEITVNYKGYSPQFYSNQQGIFLPAGFAFYPFSGCLKLYNKENQGFDPYFPKKSIRFNVEVNYKKNIYTNLSKVEDHKFSEVSNGLTLFSGMYKSTNIDGATIIYPYLVGDYNNYETQKYLLSEIYNDKSFKGKTLFIAPNVNQPHNNVYAKDHAIIN